MVGSANTTRQADEGAGDGIADPHAQPRLPPREPPDDHGRRDHPRVDVERVSHPEGDKVPWAPLPTGWFDGFQIMVRQLGAAATVSNYEAKVGRLGDRPYH